MINDASKCYVYRWLGGRYPIECSEYPTVFAAIHAVIGWTQVGTYAWVMLYTLDDRGLEVVLYETGTRPEEKTNAIT